MKNKIPVVNKRAKYLQHDVNAGKLDGFITYLKKEKHLHSGNNSSCIFIRINYIS